MRKQLAVTNSIGCRENVKESAHSAATKEVDCWQNAGKELSKDVPKTKFSPFQMAPPPTKTIPRDAE